MVIDQNYSPREAASNLGINENLPGHWVKEHQADDDSQAFRGNGKLSPEQVEIRQLKEESLDKVSEEEIVMIMYKLDNRARKTLGFKTP